MDFNDYKNIPNLSKVFNRMLQEQNHDMIEILDNKLKDIAVRNAGQYVNVNEKNFNEHLDNILSKLDDKSISELNDFTPQSIDIPDFSHDIINYEYLTERSWYFRNHDLIDKVKRIVDAGYGYNINVTDTEFTEHIDEILSKID
jgi:hypothetical protein